jgi:hypothetical protein
MKIARLLVFMAFAVLWNADARAQTMRIPLYVVGELETARINVPAGYTELSIDEIRVEGSGRGNPGLRILDESYHRLDDRFIDVRIGRITGAPTSGSARLELSFERITLGRLTIDRGASNGTEDQLVVNLKFGDGASAANLLLTGGRYDEIKIYLDRNWAQESEGRRAAIVRFSGVYFRTIALEGRTGVIPLTLDLDGRPTVPGAGYGRNALSLAHLQILSGRVSLHRPDGPIGTVEPSSPEICRSDDRRLLFTMFDARIGAGTETSLLQGDERARLNVSTSYRPCMEVNLTQVETDGTLSIQNPGGVVGSLAIDGFSGSPRRGDIFELRCLAVQSLRMVRASVDNFLVNTENQSSIGDPTLAVWGSLEVSGMVQMPSQFYTSLDNTLRVHGRDQAQNLSGIRTFLVSTLWRSFTIDPEGPAASRALYIVLRNDTRNIYGPVIAGMTDLFTGFGIALVKPGIVAFVYLILPLLITLLVNKATRSASFLSEYTQKLILNRPPTSGQLPPFLSAIMGPQRILFLLQVALISLFIQNTVLVGP